MNSTNFLFEIVKILNYLKLLEVSKYFVFFMTLLKCFLQNDIAVKEYDFKNSLMNKFY